MNKITCFILILFSLGLQGCSQYEIAESRQGLHVKMIIKNWLAKECTFEIKHNQPNESSLFIKDRTTDVSPGQMLAIRFKDRTGNTTNWISLSPAEDAVLSNEPSQFGRVLLNSSGITTVKRSLTVCVDAQRLSFISQRLGIDISTDLEYKIGVNAILKGTEMTLLETEWLPW